MHIKQRNQTLITIILSSTLTWSGSTCVGLVELFNSLVYLESFNCVQNNDNIE